MNKLQSDSKPTVMFHRVLMPCLLAAIVVLIPLNAGAVGLCGNSTPAGPTAPPCPPAANPCQTGASSDPNAPFDPPEAQTDPNSADPDPCAQAGGTNHFSLASGNVQRSITDLSVHGGIGQHALNFTRTTTSRYEPAIPTPLGSGGSWRHTYYWHVYYGGDDPATGNEIIVVDYPEGGRLEFWKKGASEPFLTGTPSISERIEQDASDSAQYRLLFPDGRKLAFRKSGSGASATFAVEGFHDRYGQWFAFATDSKNRVTRVTEPGGRHLEILYGSVGNFGVGNITFSYTNANAGSVSVAGDFNGWNTNAHPMTNSNGTWTVTVPIQLGSWQYKFVVNGSTWLSDPGNPVTVPAGGPQSGNNSLLAVAVADNDVDPSSPTPVAFAYTNASAGSVAIAGSFNGWSTTADPLTKIGNVWSATVQLPNGRHQYKLVVDGAWLQDPSNPYGVPDGFGGYNSEIAAGPLTEGIVEVRTSDGRSVNYAYSPHTVGAAIYSRLETVNYGGGAKSAQYTYESPPLGGRPVLKTVDDPRYAGPATRLKYEYQNNGITGYISAEKSLANGTVIATLGPPSGSNGEVRTVTRGGSSVASVTNFGPTQIGSKTNTLGATQYVTHFDSGYGMVQKHSDYLGRETAYQRTWHFGKVEKVTLPGGAERHATFTDATKPFYVSTLTDERGNTTTFTRDSNNRIVRKDHADSTYETWTYNAAGLVSSRRSRDGEIRAFAHDASGNLVSETNSANETRTYTHTAAGLRASETNPLGRTTSYGYDGRGQLTTIVHPDNTTRTFAYDDYGNKTSETDELGHTWTYTHDEYNRLVSRTDPLGRTLEYQYGLGAAGCSACHVEDKPTAIVLPSGRKTTFAYDMEWRRTGQTVGAGTAEAATTQTAYDAEGNPTAVIDPLGRTWQFTYDSRNRRLTATDPLGHTTTSTYDAAGNRLTETRPDNGVTTHTYDTQGRVLTATDPKNQTTTFAYTADGNLASLTDARGNTHSFEYDHAGRRAKMTYPGGSFEQWTYDGAGNMHTYRTRAGEILTCTYDLRNRDTFRDWSSATPDVTKAYDAASRLVSLQSSVSHLAYAYDAANQLLSESQSPAALPGTTWTVAYSYDDDGNREWLVTPDDTLVEYAYTARNQIASITTGGPPPMATLAYDLNGNRIGKTLENGTVASYAYDAANRLLTVDHRKAAASFARFDYTLDAVGNRASKTVGRSGQTPLTETYTYDPTDQLTNVNYGTGRTTAFNYDAVGNRLTVADSAGIVPASYSANNLNQYTAVGGSVPTYDVNGNLAAYAGQTFTYDSENRLLTAANGTSAVTTTYDARRRAVSRTVGGVTTYFVWDGWSLIEEHNASGALVAKYVHGPAVDELLAKTDTAATVYYHHDALGSTAVLTNDTGVPVETYTYDVYGRPSIFNSSFILQPSSLYSNRFLFTGREWLAEAGIYDYRNRAYSPALGRFLQTDPIEFLAGDLNLYRYAFNSPLRWNDPDGLASIRNETSGPINVSGGTGGGRGDGPQATGTINPGRGSPVRTSEGLLEDVDYVEGRRVPGNQHFPVYSVREYPCQENVPPEERSIYLELNLAATIAGIIESLLHPGTLSH